jgi:hypothetical protein
MSSVSTGTGCSGTRGGFIVAIGSAGELQTASRLVWTVRADLFSARRWRSKEAGRSTLGAAV